MNPVAAPETSALAIISLVSGILGWVMLPIVGSVAAVITGHMARAELRRDLSKTGDGLAVAGLVLGWSSFVAWLLGLVVLVFFLGGLAWLASVN